MAAIFTFSKSSIESLAKVGVHVWVTPLIRTRILIVDKAYKALFLRKTKDLMKVRFNEFTPFKLESENPLWDVLSGGLLYRKPLPNDRFVWMNWYPGPGVERYFNVYLGWSVGGESMPGTELHVPALHHACAPLPGVAGGSLDLEQIEGKDAIGGISIPSPWDQLLLVKAAAPQSVQRAAQLKAFTEAEALTENERIKAIVQTLAGVFDRIEAQLPAFVASTEKLPV